MHVYVSVIWVNNYLADAAGKQSANQASVAYLGCNRRSIDWRGFICVPRYVKSLDNS